MQPLVLVTTYELRNKPLAVMCLLEETGMRYTIEVDKAKALLASKGRINPSNGYVLIAPDGDVILDAFDLVHWIESKGLRRM
jgi:hypothetical protein